MVQATIDVSRILNEARGNLQRARSNLELVIAIETPR